MIDLSPARWIWLPSQRCLPNTFVLFRRVLTLNKAVERVSGWITADSRYTLSVNGARVQYGPAPCDPRYQDVDPVDITALLKPGDNVIGVQAHYFGHGDGTWPMGSPGLIARLDVRFADGEQMQLATDAQWLARLDRAHRPGQHPQWYLRALQEEFDARLHPYGWDTPAYTPDAQWLPAMTLPGSSSTPALFAGGPAYLLNADLPRDLTGAVMQPSRISYGLHPRSIPPIDESPVTPARMTGAGRVRWLRAPEDWFENRIPGSFEIQSESIARDAGDGIVLPPTPEGTGWFVTFALHEEVTGWPTIDVSAPEGAVIEIITQESHDPASTLWLDTHFFHWTRLICRAGRNTFACAEWEAHRWIQLHIRNASAAVTIHSVGARRRRFPWPNAARIRCADPDLQRLFDACVNTLHNSAIETLMDGAGRERQQYSGDCGHQAQVIRAVFGETRLPARYLRTFSQGMTHEGFFLDTWPAYDRLARVTQRQLGVTQWGPILDHGLQFMSDCWRHYIETGDRDALSEPYPRLLRFKDYLQAHFDRSDDLLHVTDLGIPVVWIDHDAYKSQRDKQCAYNLAAAYGLFDLAQLAEAFEDRGAARHARALGDVLLRNVKRKFWDKKRKLLVINKPWQEEDGEARLCDRSLALAVLLKIHRDVGACVEALASCPPELGLSYPATANWRLKALAVSGRADLVIRELRERWSVLPSVLHNNTVQETWQVGTDGTGQYSHCAAAPLQVLIQDVLGVQPVEPGYARYEVRPQPALRSLGDVDITVHTPHGPLRAQSRGAEVSLDTPASGVGVLVLENHAHPLSPGQAHVFQWA